MLCFQASIPVIPVMRTDRGKIKSMPQEIYSWSLEEKAVFLGGKKKSDSNANQNMYTCVYIHTYTYTYKHGFLHFSVVMSLTIYFCISLF